MAIFSHKVPSTCPREASTGIEKIALSINVEYKADKDLATVKP